jgi:hypothetical protein
MAFKKNTKEKRKVKMGFLGKLVLLSSLLVLHCSFALFAQNAGYFLDTSGGEARFIQRLTWTGDEYAQRYEVIIEREEGEAYRHLMREFTTELFMEVSLFSGKYRFHVVPHDFLNQSGERSEWVYIEVFAALYPELDDIIPEFSISDKDLKSKDGVYELQISGKNLVPGIEIFLRGSNDERIVPFEIQTSEDGTHVQLRFKKDLLIPGDYEIVVINPGGLSTSKNEVPFVPRKPVEKMAKQRKPTELDLFLCAGWKPPVTLYDEGNRFFDNKWTPAGAVINIGIISTTPAIINMGLELTESWNMFHDDSAGHTVHFLDTTLNFIMQNHSPGKKISVTFRLGIGLSLPLLDNNDDIAPSIDFLFINIGVSLRAFIWKNVYMEGGIDCVNWIGDTFSVSGSFRPWFGIGIRIKDLVSG